MNEQWTTPWYPGYVKPVRSGVYERQMHFLAPWSYWNGRHWFAASFSPYGALQRHGERVQSSVQRCKWRGLIKEAK